MQKTLGYEVNTVVIYLDPPPRNIGCAATRVSEGDTTPLTPPPYIFRRLLHQHSIHALSVLI